MTISGVALLAICTLLGGLLGDWLGIALGVKANVGGVGFAMIMLIAARLWLFRRGALSPGVRQGVGFWGALYIPIVIAMAAQQNVVSALKSGPVVVAAAIGTLARLLCGGRLDQPDGWAHGIHGSDRGAGKRASRKRSIRRMSTISHALIANGLLTAFAFVGVIMWFSNAVSKYLTFGRIHGSAIGILIGLALALWAGLVTGGEKGLADLPVLAGIGLMGGAMLRDFAIVATAFEVDVAQVRRAGMIGAVAIGFGTVLPFLVGVSAAFAFGYRDAVSLTTIGAGAITYIVGPVTGAALGANSTIMALSIATGVLKAILVMIGTPLVAGLIGLNNPRSAMVFGGLMGTVSGVSGGLAATDRRLVPYGSLTATFHTGVGCLVTPSILFLAVRAATSS